MCHWPHLLWDRLAFSLSQHWHTRLHRMTQWLTFLNPVTVCHCLSLTHWLTFVTLTVIGFLSHCLTGSLRLTQWLTLCDWLCLWLTLCWRTACHWLTGSLAAGFQVSKQEFVRGFGEMTPQGMTEFVTLVTGVCYCLVLLSWYLVGCHSL